MNPAGPSVSCIRVKHAQNPQQCALPPSPGRRSIQRTLNGLCKKQAVERAPRCGVLTSIWGAGKWATVHTSVSQVRPHRVQNHAHPYATKPLHQPPSQCVGIILKKEQVLSLNFPFQRNVKVSPFNTFHGTQVQPDQVCGVWAI